MEHRELARCGKADIEIEDHGWIIINLQFEYDNSGIQGIGMYMLCPAFLIRLMNALGVRRLSDIEGTSCWVTHTNESIKRIDPLHKKDGDSFVVEDWRKWVKVRGLQVSASEMRTGIDPKSMVDSHRNR